MPCLPTGPGGLGRGLVRETQSSCSTVLIYSRPAIQLSLPVSTDFLVIVKSLGSCVSERPHRHFKSAILRKCLRPWFWPLHLTEGQGQCHVVFWQMHSVSRKTREGHAPLSWKPHFFTHTGVKAVGAEQWAWNKSLWNLTALSSNPSSTLATQLKLSEPQFPYLQIRTVIPTSVVVMRRLSAACILQS